MNARIKAVAEQAVTTQPQAEKVLLHIGERQRDVARMEAEMNDKLSKIKAEYTEKVKPINDDIDVNFKSLHTWAENNADDLLEGKRKSVSLGTGQIGWRITPPSVRLTGVAVVLEGLKNFGLTQFIRNKEEVNKDAILADPEAVEHIKGISITQKNEFWIKPFESEIERAKAVKK